MQAAYEDESMFEDIVKNDWKGFVVKGAQQDWALKTTEDVVQPEAHKSNPEVGAQCHLLSS